VSFFDKVSNIKTLLKKQGSCGGPGRICTYEGISQQIYPADGGTPVDGGKVDECLFSIKSVT